MDFRYKITIRGWDNEAGEYTDATEQVWERTNEKLTAQEFIEEYELPPFSWEEDLEVSVYEDHFSYTQKSLPGAIRNKLLDRAWAGEVHALNEEVW